MNKITTTLAGLGLLAAVSAVPAAAQTFTSNGPFTFTDSPTTFTVSSIPATFNPLIGTPTTGLLSISGGMFGSPDSTLSFVSGGTTVSETVTAYLNPSPPTYFISGFAPATTFSSGFTFDLMGATPQAVPEAGTALSFGGLLALGGLAVLRRKRSLQNAL